MDWQYLLLTFLVFYGSLLLVHPCNVSLIPTRHGFCLLFMFSIKMGMGILGYVIFANYYLNNDICADYQLDCSKHLNNFIKLNNIKLEWLEKNHS